MTLSSQLPLFIILSALLPALLIFCIGEQHARLRHLVNLSGNVLCLILVALLINGVYEGQVFETRWPLLADIDLILHADSLSLLFVSLSGLLWFLTTLYAIAYLKGTNNRCRFFGFFSLCVAATLGVALAGNLITFVIFYELLTLTTYPLVVHKGNAASLKAGRIYLMYTMLGGVLLLAGVVWLKTLAGALDFTATGVLSGITELDPLHLQIIFILLIAGLGVKAALVPFHGWLPVAMAAPAPVSALLHAVAVVKAGAFGIIRVVYDVYGIEFARDLGVTLILAGVAAVTIVYGSIRALFQDDLKKRLAYSTVSQVSYIALGAAIAGPIATIGGMVHLVHQGVMKITLFFCAGNLAEIAGIHKVSEMQGIGRRMPLTMVAFTIASLGMIGLPPMAGFVSKWYLGLGALAAEAHWVLVILVVSSLLNAAYFLPILYAVWFKELDPTLESKKKFAKASWMLLLPPTITAVLTIATGVFASVSISPLVWVELITSREYGMNLVVPQVNSISAHIPLLGWVVIAPLAFALGILIPLTRRVFINIAPLATVPALLVALLQPFEQYIMPNLFFGSVLSLDQTSKFMLLLGAVLWLVTGIYSRDYLARDSHLARYTLFSLLCMTGSFGLILSQDLFGFLTFFTLMSFAAYGWIIHSGTKEAMLAGKTYIQWVLLGEVLLFVAFVGLAYSNSGALTYIDTSTQASWVTWFLTLGFGIKAGMLTAHFWLPRAHSVAPVPASALLSGLMVKAGLLGWWRFLPLGEVSLVNLGNVLIILGLGGAFIAVFIGITQRKPKTLLAYSTVSQMGILIAGVGAGLCDPDLWPVISPVLLIYTMYHGLVKVALFLSVGITPILKTSYAYWIFCIAILIPVLSMMGLPFTMGDLAKSMLKISVAETQWLAQLLPFTVIGTTLLMLRFFDLLEQNNNKSSPTISNGYLSVCTYGVFILFILSFEYWITILNTPKVPVFYYNTLSYDTLWHSLWPSIVGGSMFFISRHHWKHVKPIPAGDMFIIIEKYASKMKEPIKKYAYLYTTFVNDSLNRLNIVSRKIRFMYSFAPSIHPGVLFIGTLTSLILALMVS